MPVSPERWAQVRQIFDAATERQPHEWPAFVRQACGADDGLRKEVQALLVSYSQSDDFLSRPAVDWSRTLITGEDFAEDYPAGHRVGPYQLQNCLGRGGMGSVYAAERADREFDRKVAIKFVRRGMDTMEILRRFRTERQVLASLDHPNIARLIDGGSTPEGLPYLVMEFVEGRPIDQYCETHRLTVTERLTLFRSVCAAVQYAHRNLIIHRDIKPSNILVTKDGVPKLLDFGIAKLLRPDSTTLSTMPTMPHLRPMTLFYASPEQARGESVTTSTDVYSLGVLLYKLLTAKLPYRTPEHSPAAIHKAICEMPAEKPSSAIFREDDPSGAEPIPAATQKLESAALPPREKNRNKLFRKLRGDLDMILLKALRKEPGRRYISVEQFSEDIGRYLTGQPVIARKDTFSYRSAKFIARHKAGVGAGAAALLALIAASAASFYSVRAVGLERTRTERQLIEADLRVGDLERGLGDPAAAKKSYETVLATAQPRLLADRRNRFLVAAAARAELGLGDVLVREGNRLEALDRYREAIRMAEPAGGNALLSALERTGALEAELANSNAALETSRRYLGVAEKTPDAQPAIALAHERIGHLLPGTQGIADLTQAVELYRQLPGRRADLARALAGLADAVASNGQTGEAISIYRESLALVDSAGAEAGLAAALFRAGQLSEARTVAASAVEQAKTLAEPASASEADLRTAVRVLLDAPFPELKSPALAQRYALRAVALTKDNDPLTLDLLAQAYSAGGHPIWAIATEQKALALLPASQSGLRLRLEQNLAAMRQRGLGK